MTDPIIDDVTGPATARGTEWALVSDRVMGGVSEGRLETATVAGRTARHMTGRVRLDNDGGFVQMALDLDADGGALDASAYDGIALDVLGNGARYNVHLRTGAVQRPWQSFRLDFPTGPDWQTHRLRFADVRAHRLDARFDPADLRRIGLVAIGTEMEADLALARLAFYRDDG